MLLLALALLPAVATLPRTLRVPHRLDQLYARVHFISTLLPSYT